MRDARKSKVKVPFTKPMTSHQLPSSEDPGIPLSLPIESSSLLPVTPAPSDSNIDLPIALRKGKGSCTIHPITQFLSFEGLSPSYRCSCSFFSKRTQKQVYGRPLLILNGEGLWLKRRRPSKRMVPGNLFHCLKGKALLMMGGRMTYSWRGVYTLK